MVKASRIGFLCISVLVVTGGVVALPRHLQKEPSRIVVEGATAVLPEIENLHLYFGEERRLKRFAGKYPGHWTEVQLPAHSYTTDWYPVNSGSGRQGWKTRGFGCTGITKLEAEQLIEYFVQQLAAPEWAFTKSTGTSFISDEPTSSLSFSKQLPGPLDGPAFSSYRIEITNVPAFGEFSMYEISRTLHHVPPGVDPRRL